MFFEQFCPRLALKLATSANKGQKHYFLKIFNISIILISNLLKKIHKNSHTKKSYEQNKLTTMSKSEKCVISVSLRRQEDR
jgi:hypothetical protein